MLKSDNSETTESLKLPGTIGGDTRLTKQLAKYYENDKRLESAYKNSMSLEDPFKTRDKEFMNYKYFDKHSRNIAPYQSSNSVYQNLTTDLLTKQITGGQQFGSQVDTKIQTQLDKYNPFQGRNSRDARLSKYQQRKTHNTISNPKAQRYLKHASNSLKNLKAGGKEFGDHQKPLPKLEEKREVLNKSQLTTIDKSGVGHHPLSQSYDHTLSKFSCLIYLAQTKKDGEKNTKTLLQSPRAFYNNFKNGLKPVLSLMHKNWSRVRENKARPGIPEIQKKLDFNCVKKVHHNNGSLKYII